MPADRTRYQQIKDLFLRCRDLTGRARVQFLEQACTGDADLRIEVEKLLEHRDNSSDFVGPAVIAEPRSMAAVSPQRQPAIPSQIGQYRVTRLIGRGGMGVVYEARQQQPDRTVALKLISHNVWNAERRLRFEHEVEVLGRLQHPGIATIYDAGTIDAPGGREPFFAMEFVRGPGLLDYIASARLDMTGRLRLMLRICDAVQYAHQQSIVHRDIKPDNVLVCEDGQPKILDFGVAKATNGDRLTAVNTEVGVIVGTLQYMSPEQAVGRSSQVDTRSDVYSLGVLLYEVLTDRRPYEISADDMSEALKVIREQPPTRPGTINGRLRGDVETIVLKALHKEPDQRYQTAAALADDIRRFLADRPIEARPPSAVYQLSKFARRHRALVAGLGATAASLLLGAVVSSSFAITASAQRDRARREEQAATMALSTLQEVLVGTDPFHGPSGEPTVRDLIQNAEQALSEKLDVYPEAAATLHTVLGSSYYHWQMPTEARRHYRRALELRASTLGQDDPLTLDSMNNVAVALRAGGQLDEAADAHRHALHLRTQVHGANHTKTTKSRSNLAVVLFEQGRLEEAEAEFRQVVQSMSATRGEDDELTLGAVAWLAKAISKQQRFEEAEALQRDAIARLRRGRDERSPLLINLLSTHAETLMLQENWGVAEHVLRELMDLLQRTMPGDHPYHRITTEALNKALAAQQRAE